jgi:hypothetical protein
LLCNLVSGAKNQHFIMPGKSNTRWEVLSGEPGDQIVRMRVVDSGYDSPPE